MFKSKFFRYTLLGGITYLFAIFQVYLYTNFLGISSAVAFAITQVVLLFIGFFYARHWIFEASTEEPKIQAAKFLATHFVFRFLGWCMFVLFFNYMGIRYQLSIFISMGVVFPIKFFVYKFLVFNVTESASEVVTKE